jgi:hypothetical protein|tara:strand:- start:91 stop:432 length:342 start_codon:yes stop_codon:yes gene_type:complete
MSNVRNQNDRIVENDVEHYKELVGKRNSKMIQHYATPRLRHPTVSQRASVNVDTHAWAYGDRFYKLAHQYYGDVDFWWVIAWWNGMPTEASVETGDLLDIPLSLKDALQVLGV